MATKRKIPLDQFRRLDEMQAEVNCRLIPLIRLCRFASNTAKQLNDMHLYGELVPAFREQMEKATDHLNDPHPDEAHELVADVLWCVEQVARDLNSRLTAALDGGDDHV
ncbi:MAG: hypothetical protein KGZ67_05025 [Hydrogenophaga sp.]|jgi:hypothetical protein|nr:hypothetical protein [Hydrogenophaga sp.]